MKAKSSVDVPNEDSEAGLSKADENWVKRSFVPEILRALGRELIISGRIRPEGKSTNEIQVEILKEARRQLKTFGDFRTVADHRGSLLRQANRFLRSEENYLALLIFATWTEHFINSLVAQEIQNRKFHQSLTKDIVRDLKIESKLTWLPQILGWPKFPQKHLLIIKKLSEERNSFVHYKWQYSENEPKDLHEFLTDYKKTIKFLKIYSNKIFGTVKKEHVNFRKNL